MFIPVLVANNIWEDLMAEMKPKGKVTGVHTTEEVGDGGGCLIVPQRITFAGRGDAVVNDGYKHRMCLSLYSAIPGGSLGKGGDKE